MKSLNDRYLYPFIKEDVRQKMVFIGGPRQVGKTTLSLQYLHPRSKSNASYLNWDVLEAREKIKLEF